MGAGGQGRGRWAVSAPHTVHGPGLGLALLGAGRALRSSWRRGVLLLRG